MINIDDLKYEISQWWNRKEIQKNHLSDIFMNIVEACESMIRQEKFPARGGFNTRGIHVFLESGRVKELEQMYAIRGYKLELKAVSKNTPKKFSDWSSLSIQLTTA